jgi:hypothetical protein
MPSELRQLLDTRVETQDLEIDDIHPERQIRFDKHAGEPRNADLVFLGRGVSGLVAVTIEAKADEAFGPTVSEALADALERRLFSETSRGIKRIEDLTLSLVPRLEPAAEGARRQGQGVSVGGLRYQLLTALAGTLAYAQQSDAKIAVLVVHEFVTSMTSAENHRKNARDYAAFLERLRVSADERRQELLGPVAIPGAPLFGSPATLLIGKVVTDTRG